AARHSERRVFVQCVARCKTGDRRARRLSIPAWQLRQETARLWFPRVCARAVAPRLVTRLARAPTSALRLALGLATGSANGGRFDPLARHWAGQAASDSA